VWRGRRVPESPVVSVCIPVVSEHGLIEGCLDSLAVSPPSVPTEIIVVANGLPDRGVVALQERDDIVLVRSAVNAGFSGGNNLAAEVARGRYLLLLNDDSVVMDGFVDRLLGAVQGDPSIAAAGGRIVSADGTLQEAGSVLWSDGWVAHVGAGLPAGSTAYSEVRGVDYISANGLLVDRRAWDEVGGLDERYFPAYYEDVDLCLALRAHGHRVVYEPTAQLVHLESQSTSTPFRGFLLVRNRGRLVEKWSTVLKGFAAHPEVIDDAAIDAAVHRAERPVADPRPLGEMDHGGEAGDGVDPAVAAAPEDSSQRDLRFIEAGASIRDEYLAFLESELARLEAVVRETGEAFDGMVASFDEKERYIDSLPSVRAKKWVVGRLPKLKS
jgi:GT2 family glycosyltransferase